MKEKISVVLVVVALIMSTISLVLTLRTNITNVDSETTRADSLELKILNSIDYKYYAQERYYVRTDNETSLYTFWHINSSTFEAFPKIQVDVPTFLDNINSQFEQRTPYFFVARYQNTFYAAGNKQFLYCIP